MNKDCKDCKQSFPLKEFVVPGSHKDYKNGRRTYNSCSSCRLIQSEKYAYKDADKLNPNPAINNPQLWTKYRLTQEQWNQIYEDQDGMWAICSVIMDNPYVDHDHNTGKVRQLLCSYCNSGLGFFRDNPIALRAAAEYIERHS